MKQEGSKSVGPWILLAVITLVFFGVWRLTISLERDPHARASGETIEIIKDNFLQTCPVAIEAQARDEDFAITADNIIRYCRCVAEAYFNGITRGEVDEAFQTGGLPQRVLSSQEEIRNDCVSEIN